jgi:hypothetical protein
MQNNFRTFTPLSFRALKTFSSKCKPAVGAATEPSSFEYTVWYLSGSLSLEVYIRRQRHFAIFSEHSTGSLPSVVFMILKPDSRISSTSITVLPGKVCLRPTLNFLPGLTIASNLPS